MILERLLRLGEGRTIKRLKSVAKSVNDLADDYTEFSDTELRAMTDQFKERYQEGEDLDDLLPEAFAVVREAADRVLGQRHFDVQLMGAAALHFGNIAEMKTGEGKTLTSVPAVYLNALTGGGVHVVTVNDYLAKRDAEWMGRVHEFLGLSVGVILANERPAHRREQYAKDVVYGTNNEFGFDYLRDNMAWSKNDLVQRGHHFAVVDEVDSILIDEARTPLIISGPVEQSTRWYKEFSRIVPKLQRDTDYEVDEQKRTIGITESGVEKVEDQLGVENLYESANTPLISYLNNALKAKELYRKDKDYIVAEGDVMIVDEFTGRILKGRRYNEGMHQAIEAKEGVKIKDENQTLATVTLQNYFRLYDKLSGMTGTAMTEAAEFQKTYNIGVVPIPTHRTMVRKDHTDIIYKAEKGKFEAVVEDIAERYEIGQPVLVGTTSVEKSELLSTMLRRRGIKHEVLNAKNHAREADIIAQAGRLGAVTVATNMAGRGTDILLGGNPESLAATALSQRGIDKGDDGYEEAWKAEFAKAKEACDKENNEVIEAGGLYVLGTERHESRRIDNQLRGRSGRQGDPGASRFYLSLGDDLMVRMRGPVIESIMTGLRMPDNVPIEHKMVARQIANAQTMIEQQNAEIRKNVLKYDEVMNKQRTVIYSERRKVLEGSEDVLELDKQIPHMIDDVIDSYVDAAATEGFAEDWDLEQLFTDVKQIFPISFTLEELEEEVGGRESITAEILRTKLREDAHEAYKAREEELGEDRLRELERRVVLSVLDRKWREHLYEMDYLQDGIGLRAYAQRDPLVEYQREGFDMFIGVMNAIKEETVGYLFNIKVEEPEESTEDQDSQKVPARAVSVEAQGLAAPTPRALQYSAPTLDGDASGGAAVAGEEGEGQKRSVSGQKVGKTPSRNALCPCGSGKKYKKCHGAPGGAA